MSSTSSSVTLTAEKDGESSHGNKKKVERVAKVDVVCPKTDKPLRKIAARKRQRKKKQERNKQAKLDAEKYKMLYNQKSIEGAKIRNQSRNISKNSD